MGLRLGGPKSPGFCVPPPGSAELHEMPWGMLLTNSESFLPKFIPEKNLRGTCSALGGELAKKINKRVPKLVFFPPSVGVS